MTAKGTNPRVDQYVDGLLQAGAREQFERDAAADPALADELAMQQWIDQELRGMYAYEPAQAAPAPIPLVQVRSRFWKAAAIAATLLIAVAGIWLVVVQQTKPAPVHNFGFIPPDQVYAKLEADWKPEEVCTEDDKFQAAVEKRLGSPLLLASTPNVTALGWTYTGRFRGTIIGDRTMILLTNVGDAKVMVLMDRASSDRKLEPDPTGRLSAFRRKVGDLVLYEVTPLKAPTVIDHLYDPRQGKPGGPGR